MFDDLEISDDDILLPRGRGRIERKAELERSKDINCGYCKYHRNENAGRVPIDDRRPRMKCAVCSTGKVLARKGRPVYEGYCSDCDTYHYKRGGVLLTIAPWRNSAKSTVAK